VAKRVLVLANETIGGKNLLDRVKAIAAEEDNVRFHVVVPQTRPRHGNIIYDDIVRDSAQVRVDLALEFMRDEGIKGTGEVGDGDPFNAAMDAVAERGIDEILVFASDYPHWDADDPRYIARVLPDEWAPKVFHDNAAGVLRMPAETERAVTAGAPR